MKKTTQQKSLLEYYRFSKKEQKEYPVITKILKELTPERIEKEVKDIQKIKLPPEFQKWVKEYEKVGDRNEFLWKWMYKMFHIISFQISDKQYLTSLEKIKFLITMFIVQIDDAAEKKHNKLLLDEILKIPFKKNNIKFNKLDNNEKKYLKFTIKIWKYIEEEIKKYPKYRKFKNVFHYDINQIFNSIQYSYLLNKNPYLINKTEYWLYLTNNMVYMAYLTLELMCSPKFNLEKLETFREMVSEIQKMGRIGNWVNTWEREIKDGDFSSVVFAYSIKIGITSHKKIRKDNKNKIIKKIKKSNIEHNLLIEWEKSYKNVEKFGKRTQLINIKKLIEQLKYLLIVDLAARGHK